MKDVLGRWRSAKAEARFRQLEDELWANLFPDAVDAVDVATAFGPTRVYRWQGEGTPLVLLHGIGGTSLMWAPHVDAFAGRTLIAIDTMGDVGRSVHRTAFEDASDVARWLDETLDALGVTHADLVGTSYGGWMALNLALRRPARVASLTLLEPVGIGAFHMGGFMRWGLAVLVASGLPHRLRRRAARRLRMPALENKRAMRLVRRGQTGHVFRPQPPRFSDEQLRAITTPTLLLVGEKSEIHSPTDVIATARRCLPEVDARVVIGAGHALPLSHVEEVTQAWLTTHSTGR